MRIAFSATSDSIANNNSHKGERLSAAGVVLQAKLWWRQCRLPPLLSRLRKVEGKKEEEEEVHSVA